MKTMPTIGTRVRYTGESSVTHRTPCTGTVVDHYPGFQERDEETGERYRCPDHVGMQVDELPDWWNYPGDSFAPEIADIEEIKTGN